LQFISGKSNDKIFSKVTLIAISSFGFFYSSQASENTIEGYWFASGSLIEIKVCEELICAEIVHVISDEGIDPLTILDENNTNRELRIRTLVGINLFDGFQKELLLKNSKGWQNIRPKKRQVL